MIYNLFSENKQNIIELCSHSGNIRIPAILLIGPAGVGKRITAFHLIKNILGLNDCIDIFFQPEVCFLSKNLPFDELDFLCSQLKSYQNTIIEPKIAFDKLKFILLRFMSPFIYRIIEIDEKSFIGNSKKSTFDDFMENISYYFFKLKNITMDDADSLNELIDLADIFFINRKLFKSDRIYISEIYNIQKWIESTFQFDKRVILIENADLLQIESANAFLKTLEEPSSNLIFIMTANSRMQILPTILSRCSIFEIDKLESQELQAILENEWKINYKLVENQSIKTFYDFLTLLKENNNQLQKDIKQLFELYINKTNRLHLFYEIISKNENLPVLLRQLILFIESYLNSYNNQKTVIASDFSLASIVNLLRYLNLVENFSKNYLYSLDNALIYSYLNRELIFNGEYNGEKIVL
ncbi:MAG TPA: hypothetical protein PK520_06435 [Exilispira sp.]|nr:hypothetical protein [Exilispira sp.]